MQRIGFGSGFLNILMGVALALAACDGGGYEQAGREMRSSGAAAAPRMEDRQLPAAEGQPAQAYAPERAGSGEEAPAYAQASREANEAAGFDAFSRTPP